MNDEILSILREMQSDMKEMKSDINSLKSDISGLKSDISSIKIRLDNLEEQTKENTDLIKALINRTDILSAELEGFKVNTANEFGKLRSEMNSRFDTLDLAIREHDLAICRIKAKIS